MEVKWCTTFERNWR